MNNRPLVSVVIPTYKRPGMLGRAIDSILDQTYDNLEIIIVDDNHVDSEYRNKTEKFMEKYLNLSNLSYIKHNKNKGGAVARNTGIKKSRGEYIAFLDDDDEYYEKKIELQLKKIVETKVSFVTCFCSSFDEDGRKIKTYDDIYYGNPLFEHMKNNIAGTSLLLIEKKAILDIGLFEDVPSQQDHILILKLLANGYKVATVEDVLVKYNEHNKTRISTVNSQKILGEKKAYEFQKKYFNKLTVNQRLEIKKIFYNKMFKYNLILYGRSGSYKYLCKLIKIDRFSKNNVYNIIKFVLNYYKHFKGVKYL